MGHIKMCFSNKAEHITSDFIHSDIGAQYITIIVNSMQPILERIKQHNVEILSETPTILGDGRYFVLIKDPDGTFIKLIGPEK